MATTRTQTVVTPRHRLGLRSSGVAMTAAEFDALRPGHFSRSFRYELINGLLIVTPPPGNAEVDPNDELGYLLRTYCDSHPDGSSLDLTLPEQTLIAGENRRRCDRAIWAGLGRLPDTEAEAPTVAVEFVSRRRRDFVRDYEVKRAEYLAAGVREYWVIDPFRRILTVFRPDALVLTVAESETYQTPLLPGFVLPLSRLLGRADLWNTPRTRTRTRKPPAGGTDG